MSELKEGKEKELVVSDNKVQEKETETLKIDPFEHLQKPTAEAEAVAPRMKRKSFFNPNILYEYVRYPKSHAESVLFEDEKCVIIKDAYPKAAIHLLLIPKETFLVKSSAQEFIPSDLPKLLQLHETGKQFAKALGLYLDNKGEESAMKISDIHSPFLEDLKRRKNLQNFGEFQYGYHIIPSLYPLHLHIITNDFISPFLKNKKHWNSFTTKYFMEIDVIENYLHSNQELHKILKIENYENLLKNPLSCHLCQSTFPSIPSLKNHLLFHFDKKDDAK